MMYGQGNDESIIKHLLEYDESIDNFKITEIHNGIKQKNLDFILDIIDSYSDLLEVI